MVDGEAEETSLSWAQLDRRVRSVAAALQARGAGGQRVLVPCPAGLDTVVALLGCMAAGAVAVPTSPPRGTIALARLEAIVADARPALAIGSATLRDQLRRAHARAGTREPMEWLVVDELHEDAASGWTAPVVVPEALALIQYTSGSTGTPRGVMLSHRNLLHNQRMIAEAFGGSERSIIFGWLPLHHDMGLIGNVLHPLFLGASCILMDPARFIQKPLRWLAGVSRYGATISGGPNFAYDLCAKSITAEARASLDLSAWCVAFNGAEPVRAATLERFAASFAPCGFRAEAFAPCYGLAEATLIVSGGSRGMRRELDRRALATGRATPVAADDERAKRCVGCGHALADETVHVVDPATGAPCADGELGELWVASPSVAMGYWGRDDETRRTFEARLANDPERAFLRTGDLGFRIDGEIFLAGRLKDLVIVRGRNLDPQDLEETAERSHPTLVPRGGAAFGLEDDAAERERLVVVHETRASEPGPLREAVLAIRRALAEEHDVAVDDVVLVRPGSVPMTTSAKVRRGECRRSLQAGTLRAVHVWHAEAEEHRRDEVPCTPIEELVSILWAQVLGCDVVGLHTSFFALGGDSMHALELVARLHERLGVKLSTEDLLVHPTVAALAGRIEQERAGVTSDLPPLERRPYGSEAPVSYAQERVWLVEQLSPGTALYVVPLALRLMGPLDEAALRAGLDRLVERHEALRTSFRERDGHPVQVVHAAEPVVLARIDLDARDGDPELAAAALAEAEARRPFDLERGPLLRSTLVRLRPDDHLLLLTLHHIVCDHASLQIVLRELSLGYCAALQGHAAYEGRAVERLALTLQPADLAAWQRRATPELAEHVAFWREQGVLEAEPLDLLTDHRRPRVRSHAGAAESCMLDEALARALRSLARVEQVTLSMACLAVFAVFLARQTGNERPVVSCPFADRGRPEVVGLVGLFVSVVPLAIDVSGDPTFRQLLGRARATFLAAHRHAAVDFERVKAKLGAAASAGDHARVMLSFLRHAGDELSLPSVQATVLPYITRFAMADLCLSIFETGERLRCDLEYATELFDAATASLLHAQFVRLLVELVEHPDRRISSRDPVSLGSSRPPISTHLEILL